MTSTRRSRQIASIALCSAMIIAGAGCASTNGAIQPSAGKSRGPLNLGNVFGGETKHRLQAGTGGAAGVVQVQQLEVYLLTLPIGAVSRSEEFWKRVDEMNVAPETHDLLFKNGIRIGIGQSSEWSYFRGIIDRHPARTRTSNVAGGDAGTLQLEVKPNVAYQNIFYFNDENVLYGRTYEKCTNLLGISFQPAPRRPNMIRMSVCPVVRAHRKRFEVTIRGDEREIEYVQPENLYDLNLLTDVPLDGFLVIAPSSVAKWPSSLGHNFLIGGGVAEQTEQVILIVPKTARLQPISVGK